MKHITLTLILLIALTSPTHIVYQANHEVVLIDDVLHQIAICESDNIHEINGEVIRGKKDPRDIGKWQINLYFHEQTALAMNLDLFKEKDNLTYARYLYKKYGAKPWSKSYDEQTNTCWRDK